jgi:hypothetical protein
MSNVAIADKEIGIHKIIKLNSISNINLLTCDLKKVNSKFKLDYDFTLLNLLVFRKNNEFTTLF